MRKRCLDAVYRLAKKNKDIIFIGSDLGVGVMDNFKKEMPDQWFMEGVSEQHIIGMASGLAMTGKTVYMNTIATFITRRCYEQNAIDLGLSNVPVRLLGSGGGLVYAPLGPTHLATEDIALMRAIPNMTIFAPCDAEEMERGMMATEKLPGPLYVRIAKGGESVVSKPEAGFTLGKAILMKEAGDVLFVTTGVMPARALEAAQLLEADGLKAGVLHFHTIKPFDHAALLAQAAKVKAVISVEEHTLIGGLGSVVAETLADHAFERTPRLKRLGIPDVFPDKYGSQNSLLERYGLGGPQLAEQARALLRLAPAGG
jgi:transketolase